MRKISIILLLLIFSWCKGSLYAQNVVSVNKLTGTANVSIPLFNFTRGAVSFPISLVYNASGIKPKDIEGTAGMGWQLQCGGTISRLLHGLPDDCKTDTIGNSRTGWMYNNIGSTSITNFSIANTGNGNCTNEANDINYINSNFSYTKDTEPDIFYVNAPGLTCELVFDNVNQKFQTIPYQDLAISYTVNTTAGSQLIGAITSFKITNDKGVTYTFAVPELAQQQTVGTPGTYFQNTYKQFQYVIKYYDNWFLSSITDAYGNGVILNYTMKPKVVGNTAVTLYGGAASGATTTLNQYTLRQWVTPETLHSVQAVDNTATTLILAFSWDTNPSTGQCVISSINGGGRDLEFGYEDVFNISNSIYGRYFLSSYADDSGCATPVNYEFDYQGLVTQPGGYYTNLPDSSSTNLDYWGYYNSNSSPSLVPTLCVNPLNSSYQRYTINLLGSSDYTYTLQATNRYANPTSLAVGALEKIGYANGGNTTFSYESNDYFDVSSSATVYGSGIRIKEIDDNDNVTGNSITTTYSYLNPVTSASSGKPISLPAYGFTTPYTGSATGTDFWNYSTIRSATNLSGEDQSIVYQYVRETKSGNTGSTLYQYYIPATNWDNTSSPVCTGCSADWSPTVDYIARPTCVSYGSVKNDIDSYPFAPNPNYEFERGLLQKATTYNSVSGTVASETDYTYQRSSAPGIITAFKFDNNNNAGQSVMAYAKYKIFYGTSELSSTVTKKVYDTQSLNQAQQSTVTNTYSSNYHKLSSQQATNSDQSIVTNNFTYIKDYTVAASSNPNINALYHLQQLNINMPVESYTTIKRGTALPLVTDASLILYNSFSFGSSTMYLPSQTLKITQPNGGASFTPFSFSGTTINPDSRYFPVTNYLAYDITGLPMTQNDNRKNVQAVIIDHLSYHPVLTVSNAAANEIAFNDFDSSLSPPWTSTTTGTFSGTVPVGSHTGNSFGMSNGQAISFTLNKNAQANNYVFSTWISSTSGGSFTFTLTPATGTVTTYTKTFNATGSNWQYLEWTLPFSTNTTTFTFAATLSSSANIGLDDILLYPDIAEVTTYAYDPVTHYKTAQTNTNGVSIYYTSDQWGRLLFQFDQDKNIVLRNSYIIDSNPQDYVPSVFCDADASVRVVNNPIPFYPDGGSTGCNDAENSYTFDFGDGSAQVNSTSANAVTHSYATAGVFTITLTVHYAYFTATKTAQTTITINPPPPVMVPVRFASLDHSDHLVSVTFTGTNTYTFTSANLTGATIPQGIYNIAVTMSGDPLYNASTGIGYDSMSVTGASAAFCMNSVPNHPFFNFSSVNLSASTGVTIATNKTFCN